MSGFESQVGALVGVVELLVGIFRADDHRGDDRDALLAALYVAVELLPGLEAGDVRGVLSRLKRVTSDAAGPAKRTHGVRDNGTDKVRSETPKGRARGPREDRADAEATWATKQVRAGLQALVSWQPNAGSATSLTRSR